MKRPVQFLCFLAVAAVGMAGFNFPSPPDPSRYLYVWASTGHHEESGTGMVAVFDVNPSSSTYGKVVNVLTVDTAARMPHHTEFITPSSGTSFFANDFGADRSWVIEFSTPDKPRVAARVGSVPGARTMHSFARLPNGNVLATLQFGDGKATGNPGALAEFDSNGKLLKSGSSLDPAFPSGKIRTYGLTALPKIDRVVTTSSPMDDEVAENVVQVWRLSDLKLLKTLVVPVTPGDSTNRYPFELRTMADGKTAFLNSYFCGLYTITDIDTNPRVTQVGAIDGIGCAVPYVSGNLMLMPVAYAHKFVTLDISNPARPVELATLPVEKTFFPHWVAGDPSSNRIVSTDQGDGVPRVKIGTLDRATGKVTWDEKFRDAGSSTPGVSLENVSWPNGVKGKVMAHGALFIR